MKKLLLSAGFILLAINTQAQCEAVATFSEDFSNFTTGTTALPQNCWNKIAAGYPSGLVYADATNGNNYAVYYGAGGNGAFSYLTGPEVSSFDGAHQLSFTTWKLAQAGTVPSGTVTITVGTISNVADASTFVAFGEPITLNTADVVTYSNIVIPQAVAGSHIAWQFSTTDQHNAVAIDNVTWTAVPDPCPAVSSINETFDNYATGQSEVISQYCWSAIAPGTYVYPATVSGSAAVQFYSFTNPNTAAYLISPAINSFDGNHTLTFDAASSSSVVLQPGYLTEAGNADTFVAVGDAITLAAAPATTYTISNFPALTTNAYIAFRFVAAGAHNTASIDNIVWTETPNPCAPVAALDENFDNYVTGQTALISQYCWSAIAPGTYVYPASVSGSPAVQFYSFTSPNTAAYLVSPAVNSFDGNHTLTFDAASSSSVVLQPGYLTEAANAETFVPVGDVITLAAAPATTYTVSNFPTVTGTAYIAFRFVAAGVHNTASIDNIKWQTTAGLSNTKTSSFVLYPNPATQKVNVVNNTQGSAVITVFNITGAEVYTANVTAGTQTVDISGLQAGIYMVQLKTANTITTKKLIIQ